MKTTSIKRQQEEINSLPDFPFKQNDFSQTKKQFTWWACAYCCIGLVIEIKKKYKISKDEITELLTHHSSILKHVVSGVSDLRIKESLILYGIDEQEIFHHRILINSKKLSFDYFYKHIKNKVSIIIQNNHAVVLISIGRKFYIMDPDDEKYDYQEIYLNDFFYESIRYDNLLSFIAVDFE